MKKLLLVIAILAMAAIPVLRSVSGDRTVSDRLFLQ